MGRLKRYKKLKACDPCAKKKASNPDDDKYDLPPGKEEEDGDLLSKVSKKRLRVWEEDVLRTEEYVEELFAKHGKGRKQQQDKPQILPRQPHESMRAFQQRVKNETKQLLQDHAKATSSTQARRRAFLKEKKKLKKLKKRGGREAVEEYQYGCDSYIDAEMFRPPEAVGLHEANSAPPDLRKLGGELARVKKRRQDKAKAAAAVAASAFKHKDPVPSTSPKAPKEDGQEKKRRLEKVKEQVQAAYRELKKRRL